MVAQRRRRIVILAEDLVSCGYATIETLTD